MRGKVLELEVDVAIDKAVAKTRIQTQVETLYTIVGYTPELIAEKVNIAIDEVIGILKELKLLPEKEKSSAL